MAGPLIVLLGAAAAGHFMDIRPHYEGSSKPVPGSPDDRAAQPLFNFAPFNAGSAKTLSTPPALEHSALRPEQVVSNHISTLKPLSLAAFTTKHTPWNIGAYSANQHAVDQLLFGPSEKWWS